MFVDGDRMEYAEMAAGTNDFLGNLELFDTEWTDLRIIPLDKDHAVASFLFRDSIVTKSAFSGMSKEFGHRRREPRRHACP